jgi:hypothetical protein
MDFEKNGHGKSWKSHGILNGRRCTNPVGCVIFPYIWHLLVLLANMVNPLLSPSRFLYFRRVGEGGLGFIVGTYNEEAN